MKPWLKEHYKVQEFFLFAYEYSLGALGQSQRFIIYVWQLICIQFKNEHIKDKKGYYYILETNLGPHKRKKNLHSVTQMTEQAA